MNRKQETFIAANGQEIPVADLVSAVKINFFHFRKLYKLTDCGDLLQDCLDKVWCNRATFNPDKNSNLVNWTYPIVRNLLFDSHKKNANYKASRSQEKINRNINWLATELEKDGVEGVAKYGCGSFDSWGAAAVTYIPGESYDTTYDTASSLAGSDDALGCIYSCLDKLKPRYQKVLKLSLQGYPEKEIAAMLGCEPKDVHRYMFRARKAFRREMAKRALGSDLLDQYGYAA